MIGDETKKFVLAHDLWQKKTVSLRQFFWFLYGTCQFNEMMPQLFSAAKPKPIAVITITAIIPMANPLPYAEEPYPVIVKNSSVCLLNLYTIFI